MTRVQRTATGDLQLVLDREVDLVISALNLVASDVAPSTIVAGLRLGEAVLSIVRPMADERGLILEALWGSDEEGCDIRVLRAAGSR